MHVILTRLLMLKKDMRKKLDEKSTPWPAYQPINQSIINHTTLLRCTVETFFCCFVFLESTACPIGEPGMPRSLVPSKRKRKKMCCW